MLLFLTFPFLPSSASSLFTLRSPISLSIFFRHFFSNITPLSTSLFNSSLPSFHISVSSYISLLLFWLYLLFHPFTSNLFSFHPYFSHFLRFPNCLFTFNVLYQFRFPLLSLFIYITSLPFLFQNSFPSCFLPYVYFPFSSISSLSHLPFPFSFRLPCFLPFLCFHPSHPSCPFPFSFPGCP